MAKRIKKSAPRENREKNNEIIISKKELSKYLDVPKTVKEWNYNYETKSLESNPFSILLKFKEKHYPIAQFVFKDEQQEILNRWKVVIYKKDLNFNPFKDPPVQLLQNKRPREDVVEVNNDILKNSIHSLYYNIDKAKNESGVHIDQQFKFLVINKCRLDLSKFNKLKAESAVNRAKEVVSLSEEEAPLQNEELLNNNNCNNSINSINLASFINMNNFDDMNREVSNISLSRECINICGESSTPAFVKNHEPELIKEEINIQCEVEFQMTYNFKVMQGRQTFIQIYSEDMNTLTQGAYLNDKIIMFYLKFLQSELSHEIIKSKFVILDTYFYQKLSKNESYDMNEPLRNYHSVKKWTKSISVFKNDFIFVPINEDQHWSLIIICYPGRIENCFKKKEKKVEATNDNEDPEMKPEVVKNSPDKNELEEYPYIFFLDSFFNDNVKVRNIFMKYLFYEFAIKNNILQSDNEIVEVIKENHNLIHNYIPYVPKQPNTYDCGIYLLIYAELFVYDPEYLLKCFKEKKKFIWFSRSFAFAKRESIKKIIKDLANITNDNELNQIVESYKKDREDLMKDNYDITYEEIKDIFSSLHNYYFDFSHKIQLEEEIPHSHNEFVSQNSHSISLSSKDEVKDSIVLHEHDY